MIETPFRARIIANATVAGLIGTKCYPLAAPTNAVMPFVIYQRVTGTPETGAMDFESDLVKARVQVDSYAATAIAARALADAVRLSLKSWRSSDGVIQMVELIDDGSVRDDDPALKTFRVNQEYLVSYSEEGL